MEFEGMQGYYYHIDSPQNAMRKLEEPNVIVIEKLVQSNQIIEPILWILRFENVTNVEYKKYLELMEYKVTKNSNSKMLKQIEEYRDLML
ncbi:hypothetical protein BK709_18460 [Bacillus thuringiensis serovar shandongiensis]|uniref:Uncharacterized protein n=2 Tax=Bacillus TaxID=1386 RepID=A0A158RLQ1_BACC3|nr:hypothetical protein BCA_2073 [Bacillus cereus 03BB102]OTX35007.1 hypothetical protein BK717_15890 [Bacillus thuringiensis serovar malayensis]OUB05065.1 hypothetical protein BK709_18460 [Bacillus thuringiensis serovar shandongiensis]PEE23525.1 hypothetical protein CON95_14760 [Bacillus toyonensis]